MPLAFTAPQEALEAALRSASRVCHARPASPVLSGLLVASDGDRLTVAGYDQAIGLQVALPAALDAPGAAVVPGAQLADLVSRLPAGCDVAVSVDGDRLRVEAPGARYDVPLSWEPEDFPALPAVDASAGAEVPLGLLQGALSRVAHATAAENEGKGAAEGIALAEVDGALRLLASDARRASLVALPGLGAKGLTGVLPRALAREISRLPGDAESMAVVSIADGLIAVSVNGAAVVGNLLSGGYPPIERAFPATHKATIEIDAALLAGALDRIAVFSEIAVLEINFDDSALTISGENDAGTGVEQIALESADGAGELRVAFNPRYVLAALKAVQQSVVSIGLNGATGPAVIEAGFHRYLLMPIAVK